MDRSRKEWFYCLPTWKDAFCLTLFSLLGACFSFYFWRDVDLHVYGPYLTGADALLRGLLSYRDFIYLDGPISLYVVAGMMRVLGTQAVTLFLYFCITCWFFISISIWISRDLFKTRMIFFLFMIVLIFRILSHIADSSQDVLGLIAFFFIVRSFQERRRIWAIMAGLCAGLGCLMHLEMGSYFFIATIVAAIFFYIIKAPYRDLIKKLFKPYVQGFLIIFCVWLFYLLFAGSWASFFDVLNVVLLKGARSFLLVKEAQGVTPLGLYFLLFVAFYFLERLYIGYLNIKKGYSRRLKRTGILCVLFLWGGISLAWALTPFYQKVTRDPQKRQALTIDRAYGVVVPAKDATEIETLLLIIQKFISSRERILIYPENSGMYFLMKRPFYGRFPVPIVASFHEKWHKQFMETLQKDPPRYVILPKIFSPKYDQDRLGDQQKFNDVMWFISERYIVKATTLNSVVYALKDSYGK